MAAGVDPGGVKIETQAPKRRLINPVSLLWIVPLIFLGVFFFYPLGSILVVSFGRGEGGALVQLLDALSSPYVQRVTAFTFWQATISTLCTLLVGLPAAYLLARFDFRGKALFQTLSAIPFVLPTLVVAAAFNALLGPSGWLNTSLMSLFSLQEPPIQFLNTFGAIIVAHVFYNTTIVLRIVGDFWSHLDPRMSQAAQVLGAGRMQTLKNVVLPLLAPAIAAAALLVFIFDFTSFGVILVLGGPRFATLEVEIYYQAVSLFNLPLAAALAFLQLLCTLAMAAIYTRLSRRLSQSLELRPRRFTQQPLHSRRSRLAATMVLGMISIFLISPLVSLGLRSITRIQPGNVSSQDNAFEWTFDYYRELSVNRRQSIFFTPPSTAVAVSLGYAVTTVVLALSLGLPASWALAQSPSSRLSRVLDPVLVLPLGTSAVTLGLGFIVALDSPPLDLRASPVLIPLAHTLVAFPFVVRSLTPALRSISPRLRQAASVLGAAPRQVVGAIDLPLVGRALLVAATFAFTISIGEFGATALIARPEYPTIPIAIYRFIGQPGAINYGQAMALSTILMGISAAGMLVIERLRIAEVGEF